jgi:pentatricopeptide repeat protein
MQVIYTSLVHGCLLAGDVDRAWDTFDHMRQREAIEPDEVAFTLMITACAQVLLSLRYISIHRNIYCAG